jgi:hypothetical protein
MDRLGLTHGLVLRWVRHACFVAAIAAGSMVNVITPGPGAETSTIPAAAFLALYVLVFGGLIGGWAFARRARRADAVPLRDAEVPDLTRAIYGAALVAVAWVAAASIVQLGDSGETWALVVVWAVVLPLGAMVVQLAWFAVSGRFDVQRVLGVMSSTVGVAVVIAGAGAAPATDRSTAVACGAVITAMGLWLLNRRSTPMPERHA